ncbi:MAG: cyclomaltodextrinase C-terminal domain-containing protein, partial [Flavobacteriaceae bacterium]
PDHSAYKMALSLFMTTRGIPQIYYGSEIGMLGDKSKGDGDLRRDFPGGWPSDSRDAARPDQRTESENKYYHTTRTLLQWRKNNEAIHRGKTVHYAPVDQVYVYFRLLEDQWVMVLVNGSNSPKSIDLQKFKEVWSAPQEAYWVFDQKINPVPKTLTVQARDVIILSSR